MLNNNSNDNLKKDYLNNADIRLSEEEKLQLKENLDELLRLSLDNTISETKEEKGALISSFEEAFPFFNSKSVDALLKVVDNVQSEENKAKISGISKEGGVLEGIKQMKGVEETTLEVVRDTSYLDDNQFHSRIRAKLHEWVDADIDPKSIVNSIQQMDLNNIITITNMGMAGFTSISMLFMYHRLLEAQIKLVHPINIDKLVGVERNKQLRARKIHIRNANRYLIPILSLCQIAIFCIPKVYNINVSVSVNPSESSVATSSMFLLSNISKRIPKWSIHLLMLLFFYLCFFYGPSLIQYLSPSFYEWCSKYIYNKKVLILLFLGWYSLNSMRELLELLIFSILIKNHNNISIPQWYPKYISNWIKSYRDLAASSKDLRHSFLLGKIIILIFNIMTLIILMVIYIYLMWV
jgi:hypothetical protein